MANDVIYIGRRDGPPRPRSDRARDGHAGGQHDDYRHPHPFRAVDRRHAQQRGATRSFPRPIRATSQQLEDGIVQAAVQAFRNARPAEIGLAMADGSCVGTNRHDPAGPADPRCPCWSCASAAARRFVAAMVVCSMHPTVLHEDSTLVSGDFPAMTRQYLAGTRSRQRLPGASPYRPLRQPEPAARDQGEHVRRGRAAWRHAGPVDRRRDRARSSTPATSRLAALGRWSICPRRTFPTVDEAEGSSRGGQAAGDAARVGGGSPRGAHGRVRLVRRRGDAGAGPSGRSRAVAGGNRLGDAGRDHADAHRAVVVCRLAGRGLRRVRPEGEGAAIRTATSSAWPTASCRDTWSPKRRCGSAGTRR